jgi:hypothetical protein
LLTLLAAGCAPALHPVDDLPQLQSTAKAAGGVGELLERANDAYLERTLESVSRAAELGLEAAAIDTTGSEGLMLATRSRIWLSDHYDDPKRRDEEAVGAVKIAQLCRERDQDSSECAYLLALAVGVQARERRSTGVEGLKIMVELLTDVAQRDPRLDHAGPHRVLALVYLRAPGWPTGPGDPDAGLEHARHAVELEPQYPPNQLSLAEALEATGQAEASLDAYRKAGELARLWLDRGEPDAADWLEQAALRIPE